MRSTIAIAALSAAILTSGGVSAASAVDKGNCDLSGQCISQDHQVIQTEERDDVATGVDHGGNAGASNGSSGSGSSGFSQPGYSVPTTWDDYDRDATLAEWRRRDGGDFNGPDATLGLPGATRPDGSPQGAPPCGILVVPYVFTPCEGQPNTPPAATPAQPQVTIFQVIQMAMAKIQLPAPDMGSAPCTDAGCKGTVGAPAWFWLEGDQWKTYSDSASAGGLTVSVSAKPSKVVWSLGDGQSVTCTSAGTPYSTSRGWASSPDCGIPSGYSKAGTYTMTASMTYDVTFGGDASSTTTLVRTSTSSVTVGEYQAVTTRG